VRGMERLLRAVSAFVVFTMIALALPTAAVYAGTTGTIVGRIVDQSSGAPVAGANVSLVSPSQSATSPTDANGSFRFLSLAPDTYTVTVERNGYEPLNLAGVTVQADQTQTLNRTLAPRLVRIGGTTSRRASDLVKAGTTSDVYSVTGAMSDASAGLGGPGGLSNAYSAIQTVPGAVVQQGQQGWYQQLSIRGGDIDQVGYELDGIPVNRVYDNAPQTMLSTLGQQELQVYTGGTPATSDGQGLSGYVNQVIRTGTYPGTTTLAAGIGSPAFFHRLSFEIGGSTKNRNFSYYIGSSGANQDYRYVNSRNGAGDAQLFYPLAYPFGDNFSRFNIWDGSPNADGTPATVNHGLYFAPANTYAIATTSQRDNVVNLHWGLPHGKDGLKDDVQFLYVTSELFNSYYGSVNDQGGPAYVGNAFDVANGNAPGTSGPYQASWHDGFVYNGPLMAAPSAARVTPYFFPSSPRGRAFNATMPNSARDTNDNGVAVLKLQYQRNINPRSYLRLFGYSVYSNWFITGEANQNFTCCFGAELNDYEIPSHTYGGSLVYSNQITDKHLLTLSATESQTKLQRRYFYSFPGNQSLGTAFTNLIDPSNAARTGHCYNPQTGAYVTCFSATTADATDPTATIPIRGTFDSPTPAIAAAAFAGGASPQWLVTESGALGRVNNVSPVFSAVSLNDTWTPTDKLTLTLGMRVENYTNRLDDTSASPTGRNAANRAFWVRAYNNEYCYKPGVFGAINVSGATPDANGVFATPANCAALGSGYVPANFVNTNGSGKISNTSFQPRLAFTYALNPDTVVRGSFGIYARPVNTSWLQYNNLNDRDYTRYAASNFLGYGFNTPAHDLHPDTSYNYDLSLEQHLRNTDISYKATPFYRSTRDQLQAFPIGVGGIVSGFNVGKQTSYGVEVALRKGDFARDGFAAQLAYTYTHSRIKYAKFPSGTSVIDSMNLYVKDYNAYTSFCAANPGDARCGTTVGGAPAAPCYNSAGAAAACGAGTTANPYYNQPVQNLFPVDGEYTTYDQIPQAFVGTNGYETPHVFTLIANYKHKKLAITPSLTYSSGASYGSPLAYPGYIPDNCPNPGVLYQCTGFTSASGQALDFLFIPNAFSGRFDNLGAFKEPSRLTLNLQTSYDVSRQVKLTLTMTGLVDKCFQRGYAWDNPNICVYSELPSGGAGLGPSGNFVPIAQTPVQLRYPYGMFMNNLNTGFIGTTIPFQAALDVRIKL
jgi:Carboxypeptidase regulatory-like domain/TonB dependent receptor-like, beta-barrel/TonB-dependent Receptor Plug Domain